MSGSSLIAETWQLWALAVAAKVCLVLAGALVATRLMRQRPAAERHLVWVIAVAAVLALPALTLVVPAQRVSVPGWIPWPAATTPTTRAVWSRVPPAPAPPAIAEVRASATARAPSEVAPQAAPRRRSSPRPAPVIAQPREEVAPRASAAPSPFSHDEPAPEPRALRSAFDAIALLWLAGALVVGVAIACGFARVWRYARRAGALTDRVLLVRARGIADELGVRRVRVLEGAADVMPMTFGILRPTLVLPSVARQWPRSRQETVLRHELAHIRRRDSLTQLAAELACALHWFNPLVWLAARRLYIEREHACDDLVLVSGSSATDYAAELLAIARATRVRRAAPLAAIAMARPSQLRLRIAALLDDRPRRAAVSGRLMVPAWVGACALLLPLSAVAPSLRAPVRVAPEPPRANQNASLLSAHTPLPHTAEHAPRVTAASSSAAHSVSSAWTASFAPDMATQTHSWLDVVQQQDCLSRARNRTVNSNSNDDRKTIKWSGDDCSGEVEIAGEVQFDADFTTITGLSRGGSIRLVIEEGRDERRLLIRPGSGGLAYEYSVNGRRAEFDAAGQRWLSSTMLFLFRTMGLMAEERATSILERRGANALLAEVGLLSGDWVRAQYLAVLVERGRLDETSLRRVLELAGNTLKSDHYRAQVITAVAGRYQFTDAVRQAYIDAASHMSSDHYRHQAFKTVLDRGNLTPAQVSAVLREARRISSDHYRAELLRSMRSGYRMTPEIRAAYLEAAADISSDHYKAMAVGGLLDAELGPAELARVVAALETVSSDHYRAQLLTKLGAHDLREPAVQVAFVRAAGSIDSDHYKHEVLRHAAARTDLDRTALLAILDAASTMRSDHYLSELLVTIAQRHRLTGETRERFMNAMDRIRSSHYRGNVATALLRQERS